MCRSHQYSKRSSSLVICQLQAGRQARRKGRCHAAPCRLCRHGVCCGTYLADIVLQQCHEGLQCIQLKLARPPAPLLPYACPLPQPQAHNVGSTGVDPYLTGGKDLTQEIADERRRVLWQPGTMTPTTAEQSDLVTGSQPGLVAHQAAQQPWAPPPSSPCSPL